MRSTAQIVDDLRNDGYDVSCGYVAYILRERVIALPQEIGGIWLWEQADVDRLCGELRRRGRGPEQRSCALPTTDPTPGMVLVQAGTPSSRVSQRRPRPTNAGDLT